MKLFGSLLAVLLVLGVLLAVPVLAHRGRQSRDCASQIVTLAGPHGERVECVCMAGTLSTCLGPRP
jgi:hypothetical protein